MPTNLFKSRILPGSRFIIKFVRVFLLGDNRSYHLFRFYNAYKDRGIDVKCGGIEEGESFCEKLSFTRKGTLKYLLSVPKIKRIAKEFETDVIHAHMAGNYGLMAMLTGLPYVVSLWGPDIVEFPFKSPFKYLVTRIVLKRAILVHTDSYFISFLLEKVFRVPKEKIVVFPFGISKAFFEAVWEKEREDIIIFTHRKLEREYGHEVILRALRILKENKVKFRAIFASFGSQEGELIRLTRELDLEREVVFTGKIDEKELIALLSKANIFVSAATTDTTPNSLLEAMALGAFPVLSDLGIYREWIVEGINGYYFKRGDAFDLANKMLFVIKNRHYLNRALEINREIALKYANWDENFKNFLSVLKGAFKG